MLGPNRMEKLNKTFLTEAKNIGIPDSNSMMSDTTAKEAMIPYPNEVGLMKRFTDLVSKTIAKTGSKCSKIKCERTQVEGVIGNLKSKKYGFNKPKLLAFPQLINLKKNDQNDFESLALLNQRLQEL
jgi:hypothetical protein